MYRYYTKSGLDISTLDDERWCIEIACLHKIRAMEADSEANKISKLFGQ